MNDDVVSGIRSVDAYTKRLVLLTNYVKTTLERQRDREWRQDREKNRKKKRACARALCTRGAKV